MKTFRYVLGKHTKRMIQINDRSIMGVHTLNFILSLGDTWNSSPGAGQGSVF